MFTYRLEVLIDGEWVIAASGLSSIEAQAEALAFTRFKIIPDVAENTIIREVR
jgi:hypothetical protein